MKNCILAYQIQTGLGISLPLYLETNYDTYIWINDQKELIYDNEATCCDQNRCLTYSMKGIKIDLKDYTLLEYSSQHNYDIILELQSKTVINNIANQLSSWLED